MIKKKFLSILFAAGILLLAVGYYDKREVVIEGKTMGTTYHIKVIAKWLKSTKGLPEKIEARLKEVNRSMSVFQKDSEISRFNRMTAVGERFPISEDFYQVMAQAQQLYQWTDHAWDGTVMPLVNLWGFGYEGPKNVRPDADAIRVAEMKVGFNHIKVNEDRTLVKRNADVTVDLASIAKGFGVDTVARLIRENGFSNFLVEIGGEVFASGLRKDGYPWRVGINRPDKNAGANEVYRALPLEDRALATSGDYRNFFEIDGGYYSHVIDPRTGYPVTNGVVSASILADNCTLADGLATALMVMGHEKGLSLVNRLPKVECLIVVRKPDGTLTDYFSDGFKMIEK
ncbi:MAG: FAD:protein FMN transferase [Desulfobacterales bacterium]|jgi:thiamine biosynthesis lipoprotein|nr:FAD:protein FMN transferase [Desulfobacterales bacterium]